MSKFENYTPFQARLVPNQRITMQICNECGSFVADTVKHDEFHRQTVTKCHYRQDRLSDFGPIDICVVHNLQSGLGIEYGPNRPCISVVPMRDVGKNNHYQYERLIEGRRGERPI